MEKLLYGNFLAKATWSAEFGFELHVYVLMKHIQCSIVTSFDFQLGLQPFYHNGVYPCGWESIQHQTFQKTTVWLL